MKTFLILCILASELFDSPLKQAVIEAIVRTNAIERLEKIHDLIEECNLQELIPIIPPLRTDYRISSRYGYRIHPITSKKTFHKGIDLAVSLATPVHATANGIVIFAGRKGGYGRCIIIKHKYGFKTLYAHLSAYYTKNGDSIKQGQIIGFVGSTGASTGNHLHYEIHKNDKTIRPKWYDKSN